MVTLRFCRGGKPISDWEVDEFASMVMKDLKNNLHITYEVSTHLAIDAFLSMIKDHYEEILLSNLRIQIEDSFGELHEKRIDRYGRSSDWCSTEHVCENILLRFL